MLRKLFDKVFDRELEVNERIFRMMILLGSIAAMVGMVESVLLVDVHGIILPLVIMLVVMAIALVGTFRYRMLHFSSIALGLLIVIVVFPEMFFFSGGLGGGASVWFSLGLFYIFLMFSGKELVFFLILSVGVDTLCYWYGYQYPDVIVPLESRWLEFSDSLFSVLAVGLVGGMLFRFQMKMYEQERNIVKKQNEELERISNSKNSFFANMSHEIRTPINSIIGWNEMILRQDPGDEIREYALNVQNASDMLLNLVNDILDLSQMEMKKMEIVPVEYHTKQLLEDLVNMIQIRIKEKNLTLLVDVDENLPGVLLGDVKRLKQILLNLLTNAVKYTEKGSVTLSLSMEEGAGAGMARLKFCVSDTGIGIRKEDLGLLYNVFERIDTQKNFRVEGSGLGLAITKQLLDLMGGEIMVDSIYTKGSIFTIILEQKIVNPKPIGEVDFLVSSPRRQGSYYKHSFEAPEARVLVVDDNIMNAKIVASLLKLTKVQIDVVGSGAECLKKTKEKYYHVILMDYMMAGMNGAETLKALRKQENSLCRESAVIVLTAHCASEAQRIAEENHFDSFLEKPIVGKRLEEEVLRFLPRDILEFQVDTELSEEEDMAEIQKISQHKRKKIYITTDCVCDLPESVLEQMDIRMMYLYIKTDRGRFMDTVEINSDNLSRYINGNESYVKADSVSVAEYEEFFAEALTQADEVIHISMAKYAGKSYSVAVSAATGFDHVHVIDSGHISCGQGLVTMYAAKLAIEGCSSAEICEKVERMKVHVETRFLMPSAKVFAQNGYTSHMKAKILDILNLHPVLEMAQSRLQIRGFHIGDIDSSRKHFIRNHLRKRRKINKGVVFITYTGCSVREQEMIQEEVKKKVDFHKVILRRCSLSCACNGGLGSIGLAYYRGQDIR